MESPERKDQEQRTLFDRLVPSKTFVEVFMSSNSTNLSFIVGVTGNMDLREQELPDLEDRVRRILLFLKQGRTCDPQRFAKLLALMPQGRQDKRGRVLPRPFHEAFASWEGMPHTDIVVLSSLAPGADSLVATVARELGFTVKAPLPFPPDIYREASTFVRTEPDAPPERRAELSQENHQRQEKYDELLKRIKQDDAFVVRLKSEKQPLTAQAYAAELQDPARRRLRYYAAGEYIARHSHLLLAIWDDEHDTDTAAGTAAVVEARRFGPRCNVLDGDIGVGLPPGGPIWHLYTRRRKNPNAPRNPTPLRILLPEPLPGEDKPSERNEQEVKGLHLSCRIARNLDAFNATRKTSEEEVNKETRARFPDEDVRKTLAAESPAMYAALLDLARWRRRAADRGRELEEKHKNTLFGLFWFTFLAAGFFHFFAHWHVAEEGHAGHPGLVRIGFGVAALVMALTSLLWYAGRKSQGHAERGNDYRALAEGLRVQFHWSLAGLGWSVPANYMHRQRSELDWIRAAIRAATFPYHRFRDWFAHLPPPTQKALLSECLGPGWITDQAKYFDDNWQKNQHLLHFFHKLAAWMALTGILTLAGAVACVAVHFGTYLEDWGAWLILGALALLPGWWVIGWWVRRRPHEHKAKSPRTVWDRFLWTLIWLVDRITPARESETSQPRRPWEQFRDLVSDFLWMLIPSALVTVLLLGLVHQARWWDSVPSPEDGTIIWGGILLLGAALLVAWAEKALYSELAYQYGTMTTLFKCAELRLKRSLDELARRAEGSPEYQRQLEDIQDFLFALGKEALDENAEWLILHRARPLEPVMAG